jgi:hypothetical protein
MKRILPFFLVLIILIINPIPVCADVAPPEQLPGVNPIPGSEGTHVRLIAETVLIDIQERVPENVLGTAKVTASFTMQNLGTSDEAMAVRFPFPPMIALLINPIHSTPEIISFNLETWGNYSL